MQSSTTRTLTAIHKARTAKASTRRIMTAAEFGSRVARIIHQYLEDRENFDASQLSIEEAICLGQFKYLLEQS